MVEMALTLPLMLILIFGIIEFSLVIYTWARGIEATRTGARYAVVNTPVVDLSGLACDGDTAINIEADCDNADCDGLLTEMRKILPALEADNVHVIYECSHTGNPERPLAMKTPEVRVSIRGFEYKFVMPMIFREESVTWAMPEFTSTHTAEDLHTP